MKSITERHPKHQELISRKLPELITLEKLIKSLRGNARINVEASVESRGIEFPLYSIVVGSEDRTAPCLGFFAGVHGLERIGTEVAIAWLQTVSELLEWDELFRAKLEKSRMVFMPLINPVGMFHTRRSNGNGVDLMRNSPVEAEKRPAFLLGGQTYSNKLPWFRGQSLNADTMEVETRAVADFVAREVFPSRLALTLDIHSGFGSVDQLWFPYAKALRAPPNLHQIIALKDLFDRSYPNHFYKIEPQAKNYTTHGDLWDWLYDRKPIESPQGIFLPWTLELGSWIWLKKNPRQLFSSLGAFNPVQPHRRRRILRRHYTLFDFLHRAILSPTPWTKFDDATKNQLMSRGTELWYGQ